MGVVIDCFGLTDRGQQRRLNEDHFLIADMTKRLRPLSTSLPGEGVGVLTQVATGYLLVVADGMGGVAGGELASGLAVEAITTHVAGTMPWFYRHQDGREDDLETELRVAVESCRRTVAGAAAASSYRQMGTTLTLAYLVWPRVYVVHAGDSRCYLLRGERFDKVTRDHTVAQRAVEKGLMTPAQAEKSPLAHTLWNCIGGGTGVVPDIYKATLLPEDVLLLCTDGVTRHLDDETIHRLLIQSATPEIAAHALVDAANTAGGEDNITAVVARVRPKSDTDESTVDGTAFLPIV